MTTQVYGGGAPILEKIHDFFARRSASGEGAGVPPRPVDLERLVNAAFWASLAREEGHVTRLSLAYLPPEQSQHPFLFEQPLALAPHDLVKVAPAVERPGIHLGVWPDASGEPAIWGTTRTVPMLGFVLEVAGPGLLVVKHRRGGRYAKFVNVAVLEGHQSKFIDENAGEEMDCLMLLDALFGRKAEDGSVRWMDPSNVFVQLAVSMRAHKRGGILLVVPSDSSAWRESIREPIPYAASQPFAELKELAAEAGVGGGNRKRRDTLQRAVDAVAGLTAVDGATVICESLDLMGFGAKIIRRKGSPPVERVLVSEPVEGDEMREELPSVLGGTRHLSAAQFVQDQQETIALVASQDGRFTAFAWSFCEDMVHAHRIDALLL